MKFALAQMEVIPGRPSKNLENILGMVERAKRERANVVAIPEMGVGGYLLGDKWRDESFCRHLMSFNEKIREASKGIAVIWGNICLDSSINERVKDGRLHPNKDGTTRRYNAIYVAQDGEWVKKAREHVFLPVGVQAKTLLPNYRIFDDERYFFSLQDIAKDFGVELTDLEQPFLIRVGDRVVPIGIEVCEDLWCEDYRKNGESINPTKMLIENGAEYIINISNSPWTFGKNGARDRRIQYLKRTGPFKPFMYVNRTGVENNGKNMVTFDGGTTVYDAEGNPIRMVEEHYKQGLLIVDRFDTSAVERVEEPRIAQKYRAIIEALRHMKDILGTEENPSFVIGLSGGIDSAVSAALLEQAFGHDKVLAVNMPTRFNKQKTKDAARHTAEGLGIDYMVVDISEHAERMRDTLENLPLPEDPRYERARTSLNKVQYGNVMAKIRGTDIISGIAAKLGRLFPNNGNKLEVALGYATLYGDIDGAIAPIADLTKTEVVEMARYLNEHVYKKEVIPETLLPNELFQFRPDQIEPSAELEEEQVDPMKFGYHCAVIEAFTDFRIKSPEDLMEWYVEGTLDKNLHLPNGMVERWNLQDPKEFIKDLEWFYKTVDWAVFKRVQGPPIVILSKTAYGYDRRESMLAYEEKEREFSPHYQELKEKILALDVYHKKEG